eukprot:TRINITY_DN109775_c0_g1_i1.p1 TRINITY_DN109775_c0_g1~~TRINITY_DN109775_c0_g1_i1.p1  ORF type:complete len:659 (-),score=120.82 TRINITY_DN109775_c0_g1_i1:61-2037(-)
MGASATACSAPVEEVQKFEVLDEGVEQIPWSSDGTCDAQGCGAVAEFGMQTDLVAMPAVSVEDIVNFLTNLQTQVEPKAIPKLVSMTDENGNGLIEWDEFQQMVSKVVSLRRPLRERDIVSEAAEVVGLTGLTLEAAMKMRSDTSGADYVLYWAEVENVYVAAGHYMRPECHEQCSGYIQACQGQKLDRSTMIAKVATTRSPAFIQIQDEASSSTFTRRQSCQEFGIKSVCIIPFEDGVLEYGSRSEWKEAPKCPLMPKADMKKAFEHFQASYMMFWRENAAGEFQVVADYVTPQRKKSLKNRRGNDETFSSKCRSLALGGDAIVAQVAKSRREVFIPNAAEHGTFTRSSLAREFGVKTVRLLPCEGGVLEYGVLKDEHLTGHALEASLKMRCDTSHAMYSIYWVEVDGQFVVAGHYTTPEHKAAMLKTHGSEHGFAEECEALKLGENTMIAAVNRSGAPAFVANASNSINGFTRTFLCMKYNINSVCVVPTTGGVLEYGTTEHWAASPECPTVPKAQLKQAFSQFGATYVILWAEKGNEWSVIASYTIPERAKISENERGDAETFCSKCSQLKLDNKSMVALAARSNTKQTIADLRKPTEATQASISEYTRQSLAKEFGIKSVVIFPFDNGVVLEYGKVDAKESKVKHTIDWTAAGS